MVDFVNNVRSFVNYAIFCELCDRMRFEVDCAKSHHRVISEGLNKPKRLKQICTCRLYKINMVAVSELKRRNKILFYLLVFNFVHFPSKWFFGSYGIKTQFNVQGARVEMFPDCLPVSSGRQNIFSPVSPTYNLNNIILIFIFTF